MSKINCFRVINLNYNHNTMKIEDETFLFEGNSTLLSLQNGGGKSVLVQMMLAPFVRKRYRDTADREFSSFFTTNRPTFLLTEWVLDGGAGYVLVGMMVRQKQEADEETKEELDMITFVHEYNEPNLYDIHNIPVIEIEAKSKKLKSFQSCKLLLEEVRREKGFKFQYFDISQSLQQRKYFERLKEFQINHTEWETIIKKVNIKESGLSELFKDAKDEAGLVEKWFLSAVESKLNKEENRMKEFAKLLYKFILQYKENQTKIERKETILSFQADAEVIKEHSEAYQRAFLNRQGYEEKIAYLRTYLLSLLKEKEAEKRLLEDQLAYLEQEVESVYYEEESYVLYCLLDELEDLQRQQEKQEAEREQLQRKIDELTFEMNRRECAGLYEEYKEVSTEVLLLENKLEILRVKEKDLLPERNQLGYNLKCFYEQELENHTQYLKEQEELIIIRQKELGATEDKEEMGQQKAKDKKQKLGEVKTRIKTFDSVETEYNARYHTNLERNILRTYEEGMLSVTKLKLEEEIENIKQQLTHLKSKQIQLEEEVISCSRDMEDGKATLGKLKQQELHQKEVFDTYEEELRMRAITLRFIGLTEEELFQKEAIAEVFDKKKRELEQGKRALERKKETLEEEYHKLATGQLLELPKELEELLGELDIVYLYGMEWLKKNGNTTKANEELVKQNPMLPFSIILSHKDLRQLADVQVDFYTSFPIPIIIREELYSTQRELETCIYEGNKISFFVMFNHYLLDEVALKELLETKRSEIEKTDRLLIQREGEIKEYEDKYNLIKYQSVTKESYLICQQKRSELQRDIAKFEDKAGSLRSKKEQLQQKQREISLETEGYTKKEFMTKNQLQDFVHLQKQYEHYLEDRHQFSKLEEELNKLENEIKVWKTQVQEINQFLRDTAANRERGEIKREQLKKKVYEYQSYSTGELIKKDIEDIEARFEALTKKISEDQASLEESLQRAKDRFDKKQNQLLDKEKLYRLSEADYTNITTDNFLEGELRKDKSAKEKQLHTLQQEYHTTSTRIAVVDNRRKEGMHKLFERFEQSEPVPRSKIVDLEFKKRIKLLLAEIEKEEKKEKVCLERIKSYEDNLSNLAEFEHFTTDNIFSFEEELKDTKGNAIKELDAKELISFRGKLVRDYRKSNEDQDYKRELLQKCMDTIIRKPKYEEDFFKRPLETMQQLVDSPHSILEQLAIILSSFQAMLEKLEVDIAMVDKEREKVTDILLDYILEIHKNLGKIDRNSTITIRDRTIKMLKIKLPEWEEQEKVYQLRLADFIEGIVMRGLKRLEQNENIEEMIGAHVTTKNLYDTVVGIGNITIKLYKIEAQREYPITWAEVSKNSGGEGFLSAFVVLSSLLSYMRRDDTDLFYEKEEGKVLVMDNPFAQTNAAHLLKPLMDIARKNNTQLICLSGLGGESIYNRFDNIYVLNLMNSGLRKDITYLKGERLKEEKSIIMVSASQVKVEEMEQIELLF